MKNYEQMAADVLRRRDEQAVLLAQRRRRTVRICSIAATCFLTVGIMIGIGFGRALNRPDETTSVESPIAPPAETHEDGIFWLDTREHGNTSVQSTEFAIEWPWEDLTDAERYTRLDFEGETYYMSGTLRQYIGDKLTDGEVYGYGDFEISQRHTLACEIFEVTFSPNKSTVAVRFKGDHEFYRYKKDMKYDPPATLGEFMETRRLAEVLPLTALYYRSDSGSTSKHSLTTEESAQVWTMLTAYGDAPFVEGYTYYHNKEDVSFSATSEIMGICNLAFTVNEDGYIITNIEQYGYYFHIGKEAARQVLNYVEKHRDEPLPEPQNYSITGYITEIGDGYIKVDDSVMMKNPDDGLVFTIITDRKELSRVVGILNVGSAVTVTYDGFVSKDDPLLIKGATSIQGVYITGSGSVVVPE